MPNREFGISRPELEFTHDERANLRSRIEAFVGRLEMARLGFLRAEPDEAGRPGYDPLDLLKLYLYGYLQQVRSSRRGKRVPTQHGSDVVSTSGITLTISHPFVSD